MGPRYHGNRIDKLIAAPIDQLLTHADETYFLARLLDTFRRNRERTPMWILYFGWELARFGIDVLAHVRVVDERNPVWGDLSCELVKVVNENVGLDMYKRIKGEGEIDRVVSNHAKRATVIHVVLDSGDGCESALASFDTFGTDIHEDQVVAQPSQELCPASKTWGNLEDGLRWDK